MLRTTTGMLSSPRPRIMSGQTNDQVPEIEKNSRRMKVYGRYMQWVRPVVGVTTADRR